MRSRRDDDAFRQEHLRLFEQGETQKPQPFSSADDRFQRPEAEIECHLVVAGAARVDASSRLAGELDQAPLDVQVNVLVRVLEAEAARRDLLLDRL